MAWTGLALLGLVLGGVGCGPTILEVEDDDGSSEDGPMTTRGTTTTTTGVTTVTTVTTAVTRGLDTGDTDGTLGPDDTGVTTDPPPPLPDMGPIDCELRGQLGDPCTSGADCCTGQCFVVGALGGVCSECDGDEDCAFGCNFGSPLDGMPALCGDGTQGSGCETDRACAPGLYCVEVIEVPGVIESSSCSECEVDADCGPGLHCAPSYDQSLLTGSWQCVAPGSLPLDFGCAGDEECASGQCAVAMIMGIPYLTVCSECNEDTDCVFGFCFLPEIVIDGTQLTLESGFCG